MTGRDTKPGDSISPAGPADRPKPPIRFFRPETVVFMGLWLLLMLFERDRCFGDPGSLWHLVLGERMLATGELVRTDPFSFTRAGQPALAQGWLFDCAAALLHRGGGLDLVLLAYVTLLAGLFTWLFRRALRVGIHPLIAALITTCALFASVYHLHPRPHMITIVLTGWTLARLADFEAGRISLLGLAWLLPVYVLWTNVHGGMAGGVAMLVAAAVGWGLARMLGWDAPLTTRGRWLGFAALTVGCALTALVNPFGLALPRFWFKLVGSPVLPRYIEEHAPLLQTGGPGQVVIGFGLFYLAALVGTLPSRPRVAWLLPLLWLALTWTRIRYGPLFAVTAAVALADMFPHIRWVAWLARKGSQTCRVRPPEAVADWRATWLPSLAPTLLVFGAAFLQLAGVAAPVVGRGWAAMDPGHWPVGLLPQLREYERGHARGTGVFNDMIFGGYLIYFTPDLRVFIDDRWELYGDEGIEEYADAFRRHPERIEEWAKRYDFDLALVLPNQGFDLYLRTAPGWTEVGRTESAALYQRSRGPAEVPPAQ